MLACGPLLDAEALSFRIGDNVNHVRPGMVQR